MDEYNNEISIAEFDTNRDEDIKQKLNPWFSIWTKPRKTIRYIINDNPRKYVILLAIISGIIDSLDKASSKNMGENYPMWGIFLVAIVGGSLGGIIFLYLFAALIKWTGKCMDGEASTEHIRAAIAWGTVPYIYCSILWIPELILFGEEMFISSTPTIDSSSILFIVFITFSVIQVIVGIWSAIVFYKCLGEVQGFSAWKALWNCILAGIVIAVPVIIISIPFVMMSV